MSNRRIFNLLFVLVLVVTHAGCELGDPDPPESFLRIVHATQDSGALDIYINTSSIVYGMAFAQKSLYFKVSPGTQTLSAFSTNVVDSLIFSEPITLQEDVAYTAVLISEGPQTVPHILEESGVLPDPHSGKFRFFHAAESAGNLDVYFTLDYEETVDDMEPKLTGLRYKQESAEISAAEGMYDVYFTEQGTKTVLTEGIVTLVDGNVILMIPVESGDAGEYAILSL